MADSDSDFRILAECLDATWVTQVSCLNPLDMKREGLIYNSILVEYSKLVFISSYDLCTEDATVSCIHSSVCESFLYTSSCIL
jgi:hypothetical protein